MDNKKNILVINVNWLGDVVFSSPIFKALKEEYPGSQVTCMAPSRVRDVVESIPFIDDQIVYDDRGEHRNPLAKFVLIQEIKKRKFDIVFILHRSLTKALIPFLAGIPERVGYDTKKRGKFLTTKIDNIDGCHRSDYYMNIIESYGIKIQDRTTLLTVSVESDDRISEMLEFFGLKDDKKFIVINPGGNWDLKRWPKEYFKRLAEKLSQRREEKIIISGAEKDIELAGYIAEGLQDKVFISSGKTSIKDNIALMKRAELVISSDSGPLHLASSVGTKTIGIFGPTSPKITGPKGPGHCTILRQDVGCNREPCYFLECNDNVCMKSVSVESVLKEVENILK